MTIMANKLRIVKTAIALTVAAAVIIASAITVVAAVQTTAADKTTSSRGESTTTVEYELSDGNLVVCKNDNFNLDVKIIDANEITITSDSGTQVVYMAKGTVSDALDRADIKLSDNEMCIPSADYEIKSDTQIKIYKTKDVTVTADGKTKTVKLPRINMYDALNAVGYKVDKNDILSVSNDNSVNDISEVTLKRVEYKTKSSSEKIAFDTVRKNSDEVALGTTKVKTEGKSGEKIVTREIKYVDGKAVSEKVVSEKTVKEPVDEVVLVGTKGAASSGGAGTFTDSNGATVAYSQVLTGSGTAYTAPAGASTATGVPAYHGGVAVNPNIIPYGSKLYIVSTDGSFVYGYATAVDTGGALMDGSAIVDCFYNTYNECVNFGRRDVKVYVLV